MHPRYTSSPPNPGAPLQQQQSAYMTQAYPFQPQQQAPLQHQQHNMGQMRPQPQLHQQPGAPVDFAAWGMNDATAQFGMQLGQSAVAAGQDYVQKNFGGFMPYGTLKHHFNVSNSYVVYKLRLVLFPWRHKPWTRRVHRPDQGYNQGPPPPQAAVGEWMPPRDDINSPDLYIPLMALVTYILLSALHKGFTGHFDPAIFGSLASRALGVLLLDVAFVKMGCYVLGVGSGGDGLGGGAVADVFAYGGYKFVGVILTLLAGMCGAGVMLWSTVFLYAFFANAFFLLRSLRSVVLPDAINSSGTVNPSQRKKRITFLFLEAVSQIIYMGILVRI
ncbi:hypothetical protein HWV62_16704 [Athelia sp. TMB]|nr:hypothetical protein HWV62_16704 [Athelia sp. TMB]